MNKQTFLIVMAIAITIIIISIVYLLRSSSEDSSKDSSKDSSESSSKKSSGYTFHPKVESAGFDIAHHSDLKDNISEITKKCNEHPNCIAFNSDGWLKYKVKNKNKWEKDPEWMTKEDSGLYIHNNPSSKYTFYPHVSSSGYDISYSPELAGNLTALSKLCDEDPKCVAFTSGGWLKHAVATKNDWNFTPNWITDANSGLYIKNEV